MARKVREIIRPDRKKRFIIKPLGPRRKREAEQEKIKALEGEG